MVKDPESNSIVQCVEHNHFKSWPDWEIPHNESMMGYQELIKETANWVINHYNGLMAARAQG